MEKIRDFTLDTIKKIKKAIKDEEDRDEWGITDTVKDWVADNVDTSDYIEDVQKYCNAVVDNKDINNEKFDRILSRVRYVDASYQQRFFSIAGIQIAFSDRLYRLSGLVTPQAMDLSMDEYKQFSNIISSDFDIVKEVRYDSIKNLEELAKDVNLEDLGWWESLSGEQKYKLFADVGHIVLDGLGMIPEVGIVFDGVNCAWYAGEQGYGIDRKVELALTGAALVPFTGEGAGVANTGKSAGNYFKMLKNGELALVSAKEVELALADILILGDGVVNAVDMGNVLAAKRKKGSSPSAPDTSASSGGSNKIGHVDGTITDKVIKEINSNDKTGLLLKKLEKALKKGLCGSDGQTGVKLLGGKGIKRGKKWYKYEIKIKGKGGDFRIFGNKNDEGKIIFEEFGRHKK